FSDSGRLEKFLIKEGRIGEFVKDKNGNLISLTALIFGRHHPLFDQVDFIQVKQVQDGELIIYFSANREIENPSIFFNINHIYMDFKFEQYKEPYRTSLGKTPLLIK